MPGTPSRVRMTASSRGRRNSIGIRKSSLGIGDRKKSRIGIGDRKKNRIGIEDRKEVGQVLERKKGEVGLEAEAV